MISQRIEWLQTSKPTNDCINYWILLDIWYCYIFFQLFSMIRECLQQQAAAHRQSAASSFFILSTPTFLLSHSVPFPLKISQLFRKALVPSPGLFSSSKSYWCPLSCLMLEPWYWGHFYNKINKKVSNSRKDKRECWSYNSCGQDLIMESGRTCSVLFS